MRSAWIPLSLCALCGTACSTSDDGDGAADAGDAGDGGGDSSVESCWSCHGTEALNAPPPDRNGETAPSSPGVGAHAAHFAESDEHGVVRCSHCHPEPESPASPGHVDDQRPADVVFSTLATVGGEASYEGGRCAVYCHGAFLHFESMQSPEWTDESPFLGCTGCHGNPPPAPHPAATDCGRCHLGVADLDGTIRQGSLHVDGLNLAPKGAHLVHLGGAGGEDHACDECHDGERYHGDLRDGANLDATTICEDCHDAGTRAPSDWRDYQIPEA